MGPDNATPAMPLRAFLLEGANLCPPYLDVVWGTSRARSLGGSASDGSAGGGGGKLWLVLLTDRVGLGSIGLID